MNDLISRIAVHDRVDRIVNVNHLDPEKVWFTPIGVKALIEEMPSAQPEPQWIPCSEKLPENADHPGAFCPRYQVTTPYGVTEGWYRPHDHEKGGQWYALFWFMSHRYEIWNIDFERGDVPKIIGEAPVMAWRPFPEAYKEVIE